MTTETHVVIETTPRSTAVTSTTHSKETPGLEPYLRPSKSRTPPLPLPSRPWRTDLDTGHRTSGLVRPHRQTETRGGVLRRESS